MSDNLKPLNISLFGLNLYADVSDISDSIAERRIKLIQNRLTRDYYKPINMKKIEEEIDHICGVTKTWWKIW